MTKCQKQTIIPCKNRKKVCKKRLVFYTYNIYNQHFKYKTALKKVCKTFLILFFNIIFIKFAESKNKKVIANKISKKGSKT